MNETYLHPYCLRSFIWARESVLFVKAHGNGRGYACIIWQWNDWHLEQGDRIYMFTLSKYRKSFRILIRSKCKFNIEWAKRNHGMRCMRLSVIWRKNDGALVWNGSAHRLKQKQNREWLSGLEGIEREGGREASKGIFITHINPMANEIIWGLEYGWRQCILLLKGSHLLAWILLKTFRFSKNVKPFTPMKMSFGGNFD